MGVILSGYFAPCASRAADEGGALGCLTFGCALLLAPAANIRAQNADSVDLLKNALPDSCVDGAERLLSGGGEQAVMGALVAGCDGFAGRDVGRATY